MILVDSGFLIALAQPRDALHARAMRWSQGISESFLVSEYVALETMNRLSEPADRPRAHALLAHVLARRLCEFVHGSPALWEAGLALHRDREDKAWSLTDCISFHLMSSRGIAQALAFDEHFEQAGFVALLRREP
jgi:predicted nucleic acid-binding protein